LSLKINNLLLFINRGYNRFIEAQQVRMSSSVEGLPLLAALGLVCGLLSGGLIILFRLVMEGAANEWLPNGSIERFEELSGLDRLALCTAGGLIVGLILHKLKPNNRGVGVVHVLERLDYHRGYLPMKNAIVQFVTATISLLSGQSVGREGPSVHLGAAAGSALGRSLHVPNNSIRILVGCGVAAAIAAAFNTPLAGVIFAMEVVIMDYTVVGFTPVILASISAYKFDPRVAYCCIYGGIDRLFSSRFHSTYPAYEQCICQTSDLGSYLPSGFNHWCYRDRRA